jgi:hypothetical protein
MVRSSADSSSRSKACVIAQWVIAEMATVNTNRATAIKTRMR